MYKNVRGTKNPREYVSIKMGKVFESFYQLCCVNKIKTSSIRFTSWLSVLKEKI